MQNFPTLRHIHDHLYQHNSRVYIKLTYLCINNHPIEHSGIKLKSTTHSQAQVPSDLAHISNTWVYFHDKDPPPLWKSHWDDGSRSFLNLTSFDIARKLSVSRDKPLHRAKTQASNNHDSMKDHVEYIPRRLVEILPSPKEKRRKSCAPIVPPLIK